ncbi:MAG: peptidylprolyl isomerase [Planctomycetia bacterium]|nr:peptidylprolyl isomerase [Planctomycetia bacterium]
MPHRIRFARSPRRNFAWLACCSAIGLLLAAAGAAHAQSSPGGLPPELTKVPDDTVVATVDGAPIRFVDVRRQILGSLEGRKIPSQAMPLVYAQSLDQIVQRRLIAAKLKALKFEPTPEELAQAEAVFQAGLKARDKTPEAYFRQTGFTAGDIAEIRYWDICWHRYVAEQLTDAALEKYFAAHRRDFDGTEVRVSHILLRIEGQQDQATVAAALQKAGTIRSEILGKQTTFAEAAKKYSAGPSREQAGDLGFIPRQGRMVEAFSKAAFALKKDELSEPVVSPFGVHLITVTEEKPGDTDWRKVREPLVAAARLSLFQSLGAELKGTAKIEFTGAIPHFDPTTGKIVAGK